MALKRSGLLVLFAIIALALVIAALFVPEALPDVEDEGVPHVLVRFLGLYGFLFLAIATLITPFLTQIVNAFGKPFLKVHHAFSVLGIVLITLHPVFNAVQRLSLSVFIPNFSSWDAFWALSGRPALIIMYVAVAAALLRRKTTKYWRPFHTLMYVVLIFGIVHANLIGDDFENLGIMLIFNALFIASISSFVYNRYKNYQIRRKYRQSAEK